MSAHQETIGIILLALFGCALLAIIVANVIRQEAVWFTCSKCQHHFNRCGDRTIVLPHDIPEPLLTGVCDECESKQQQDFQDRPSSKLGNIPSKERRVTAGNGRF